LTEEQQGGPAPEPEANASAANQASEEAVGTIAVADEPATTETTETTDTPATTRAATVETAEASTNGVARGEDTEGAGGAASEPAEAAAEPAAAAVASAEGIADPAEAVAADVTAADSPAGDAVASSADEVTPAADEPEATAPSPDEPAAEAAAPVVASEATSTDSDFADAPPAAEADEDAAPPPRELGPEPTTMEELLAEQDSDIKSFKHGDVVEGNVVRIDKDEILVDIGAKSEGVVSNRELYGRHAESQPQLAIGDTVLVYVLQPESQEGHVVLSLRRAGLERKWRSMQEQFETGVIIEAPVIDHNKGGLIVDCGIRGFVPISQIVDFPRRPQNDQPRDAAQEIAEKLMPFVGRKLRLKILEVNRKANRLILSEKVALYEERREKRDELFSSLQVGQKVTGTVRSIAPFGVFIDLGGIDGLVHKSELSWNKVNNPEAGYKVGDEVEAEVIDINHERGRISLSIRRLQPDPWHSTVADFKVGDVIDGTVTKLVNFGAFVRVRDGLEGLIHISELSHQRVAHPGDVVHEGQNLKLKIISLDSERHRLGLSLKQAEEAPARPMPEPGQPGQPGQAPAARGERRPRQERSWSASDAVQEPEGGIDNTLAAAFAQVREQVAASEAALDPEAPSDEGAVGVAQPVTDAPAAEVPGAGAPEPAAVADAPEAAAIADAPQAETPAADAVAEPPEAEAEAVDAAAAPDAEVGAVVEAPEAEAVAEAETPADAVAEAETPADAVAEAETPADAVAEHQPPAAQPDVEAPAAEVAPEAVEAVAEEPEAPSDEVEAPAADAPAAEAPADEIEAPAAEAESEATRA
jgi:small subunit ribosomal protein S1